MPLNIYQDIQCPYFPACSGCSKTEKVNQPPIYQEVVSFFADRETPFAYHSGKTIQWRMRAKLAVRGSCNDPQIGLYQAGTHDVVNIPECRVHHPQINQAVVYVKEWIKEHQLISYDENKQEGCIRYIQCVVERATGRIQLVIVINAPDVNACVLPTQALWDKKPDFWHSIWVNTNQSRTNNIFGEQWTLIKGHEYIHEKIAGVIVCYHPANFAQANLDVFETMLIDLKADIKSHVRVAEFYAGVGVIGLSLADKVASVVCGEINPYAENAFYQSLEQQSIENVSFETGSSVNQLALLKDVEVVIVDPPRKGLDKPLLKALCASTHLKELWYVSCGWASFKRDCEELQKKWTLKNAKAYLFFPGTNHLEILAKFEYKS